MYSIREIDVAELKSLLDDVKSLKLFDVRNPFEVTSGAIPGAENMPLHTLPFHADGIDSNGEGTEPVVFYCQSGGRSAQACMFMTSRGYENVLNLRGGIQAWIRSGLMVA